MAVYRSMYDVPLDLPITTNKTDDATKSDRNTKSFVNKTNKKIYRKKSTTTHKRNRNDVYDTSSYTESDTTDESEDEQEEEDDETEYTDEDEISDNEETSSFLSEEEEEEKQYTNSKRETLKRKTKKRNPTRFTTKPVGLRKREIDRVLFKYGKLIKRERTANIIASKSTPDVMTLSRMAKQIRNKQLYLPKGGYLKTALKTLANGTLHQKRSVLVTKPDLLTSIIKRSESDVKHHGMDTDTTEDENEEEDNQTEDDK